MKLSIPYRILRGYIRFVTNGLYYKSSKVIGTENIPDPGVPTVIVSNHFHCMNDALAVLLSVNDRKPCFIVRADVFSLSRLSNKFLRSIGLLPAYRMGFDKPSSMSGNDNTFNMTEEALHNGETVTIFPQAGHSEGYWIDRFTGGTAKMIFEAAALSNFEKEILIVPSCNYYSAVSGMRNDVLIKFGEPLKASQFYELYKVRPHGAIKELTELMWNRVEPMMLDIRDRENYEALRFILESGYPALLSAERGLDCSKVEDGLEISKYITETLYKAHREEDEFLPDVMSSRGQTAGEIKEIALEMRRRTMREAGVDKVPEGKVSRILSVAEKLSARQKALGLEDGQFSCPPGTLCTVLKIMLLLLLSPLALIALWPSAPCWIIPHCFSSKSGRSLFEGTFLIALNVLFLLPICAIVTLVVGCHYIGIYASLAYVLLFPALILFEWYYSRLALGVLKDFRWFRAARRKETKPLAALRKELFSGLDEILK